MAFHHCDLLLQRSRGKIYDIDELKRRLEKYKGVSEIIHFSSVPDCIAFYGDPERKGTQIDALEHYIDISDVENAVKVFKKLPKEVRGEQTPEEFGEAQFLEKHLEEYWEKHLDKIEPGLKWLGRQYKSAVGSNDLFAEAENDDFVVIELKKGRAADKMFGQVCRYMGCIKEDFAKGKPVRGYIVSREADVKLQYATKAVAADLVKLSTFQQQKTPGGELWIEVIPT